MSVEWNFASTWEAIADAQPRPARAGPGRPHPQLGRVGRPLRPPGRGVPATSGSSDDGKVASYLYNSIEYMEGVFATWKCGGAPVNVNYRYLEDELAYLLTNSDTEILLFHGVARRARSPRSRRRSRR